MNKNFNLYCSNCGNRNHEYKDCTAPITSWGLILVDLLDLNLKINHNKINIKSHIFNIAPTTLSDITILGQVMPNIRFLLAQRKHSYGFIDFVRGKYRTDNIDGINSIFQNMTPNEIEKISTLTFDELWINMWNNDQEKMNSLKKEYTISLNKYNQLKEDNELDANLDFYLNNVKSYYKINEWGFPKGRRNRNESNRDCAIREFEEETNIDRSKFNVIDFIDPLEENFIGTNGLKYRNVYYIAELKERVDLSVDGNNEIAQINLFNYNDSISIIRDYQVEKKEVLTSVYYYYLELIINSYKN
jgi:8-oxo-dGTP pyrophosphatase MutT (NUDIX family)